MDIVDPMEEESVAQQRDVRSLLELADIVDPMEGQSHAKHRDVRSLFEAVILYIPLRRW